MATAIKHGKRSKRNYFLKRPIYASTDKASHVFDSIGRPIYKAHFKKYDGNGNWEHYNMKEVW